MVQAILEGRKSQTRRVAKLPNGNYPEAWFVGDVIDGMAQFTNDQTGREVDILCPYGQTGDRLYVRETWRPKGHNFPTGFPYEYKATAEQDGVPVDEPWKSSMFMPKKAARIWLKITDIRVGRVQDITEDDVKAEGVRVPVSESNSVLWCLTDKYPPHDYMPEGILREGNKSKVTSKMIFKAHFASLWDSINQKRGYGWESNPWVWIVEFKTISINGRPS